MNSPHVLSNSHDWSSLSCLLPWSYLPINFPLFSHCRILLDFLLFCACFLWWNQPVVFFFSPFFFALLFSPPYNLFFLLHIIYLSTNCSTTFPLPLFSILQTSTNHLHCGILSSPACRAFDHFIQDPLTILLPTGPGGKRQVSARLVTGTAYISDLTFIELNKTSKYQLMINWCLFKLLDGSKKKKKILGEKGIYKDWIQ